MDTKPIPLELFTDALKREAFDEIQTLLGELHPAEVAELLESLLIDERDAIWHQIHPEDLNDVLAEVEDEVRVDRLLQMHPAALAATR